jgi:D-alanine-D-alanine ligase
VRVLILHDRIGDGASPDALDVRAQAESVRAALRGLGHSTETLACDPDLSHLERRLVSRAPDLVFNLVESLGGDDRLIDRVPALLDTAGVPYTGAPTEAIRDSTDKVRAKRILRRAGLPVAEDWVAEDWTGAADASEAPGPWIIKAVHLHGSIALDDSAVVDSGREVPRILDEMERRVGSPCFAELYLPGREFNLSLVEGATGPEVLPPAEILFDDFPPGKPRIVGYDAKWSPDSFEYVHSPRSFAFEPRDRDLLRTLEDLALDAWRAFGTAGYARVDFRLDARGGPRILELNVNPCLSPDAGFAAALEQAGLPYDTGIERIVEAAAGHAAVRQPLATVSAGA